MLRAHQAGDDAIGEDVRRPQARHVGVEPVDVRQAAAEDDDVGIEKIDDAAERARHALFVARKRRVRQHLARRRSPGDFFGGDLLPGVRRVVGRQRGAREKLFDAAAAAAVTRRPG